MRDDGSGQVAINGQTVPVYRSSLGETRSEVMRLVMEYSASIGLAVEVQALGPEGPSALTVHPDGRVVHDEGAGAIKAAQDAQEAALAAHEQAAQAQAAHEAQAALAQGFAQQAAAQAETAQAQTAQPSAQAVSAQAAPAPAAPAPAAPAQPGPAVPAQVPATVPAPAAAPGVGPQGAQAQAAPAQAPAITLLGPEGDLAPEPAAPGGTAPAGTAPVGTIAPAPATSPGETPFSTGGSDAGRRDTRRSSFLVQDRLDEPATQGLRGVLARVGLRVPPSESERSERADEQAVSQHWQGPRTIAIVNGKGGAGKTPSTVLLGAVFAQFGGSGVVAWDNNQTRGTLGWRTEQGDHEATLLDLIPQTEHFLGPTAQLGDLAGFVHHQSRMRFDVLRSKPMALAHEQRISSEDVDAIHAVLAKFYRMIFIDSGNDESDPMWLRMIDHTDQLVVATSTRDDHAEAGALLLEALANRGEHMADLARKAVVVVSQSDPKATPADLRRVAQGYRALAREVVTVPFDPAMVDGQLDYRALRPQTRRAWLAAGAAVSRGF
ncbi:ATPase [Promicromonospora sukumoe]|uniref:ATPase n=1 Tax=Promicromonospora sukumoe TaxID=88382 RepID=UPI00365493C2